MKTNFLSNIREFLKTPDFSEPFKKLFSLSRFFEKSIIVNDYKPPDSLTKSIALTPQGEELVSLLQTEINDIPLPDIYLSLFIKFFHNDILIDIKSCNPSVIIDALSKGIIAGNIKFPWVYDRFLYDRFYNMFPEVSETLTYEETLKLLDDSPKGVFQITDILVGPFGVLNSSCHRYIDPLTNIPLWHCPDPSCTAIHPVLLSNGDTKVTKALAIINQHVNEPQKLPEISSYFFRDIIGRSDYYDDMSSDMFPWLLANSFSHSELQVLLRKLIDEDSKSIRERVPQDNQFQRLFSASGDNISKSLSKDQCFQLILLEPDDIIIKSLESLIHEDLIRVPATEIRAPELQYLSPSWLDTTWECSKFGFRSTSDRNISLSRLNRILTEIYAGENLQELEWKLRNISGADIYERLYIYISSEEPKDIIRNLILDTEQHLKSAINNLRYGLFLPPSSPKEDDFLIEIILWKLGFEVPAYPQYQRLFWARLARFIEVVKSSTTFDEKNKEIIRSNSVNFFISLEEILEYSLSFTAWALLSDHFLDTKFQCDLEKARQVMASFLNGRQFGSNEPIELDPDGKNTLYPLIQGFAILSSLCSELINGNKRKYIRKKDELPGYCGKTTLSILPFLHKMLIFDIPKNNFEQIIELLNEITHQLEISQICDIRNRLEHKRTDFPNPKDILSSCDIISSIIKKMEEFYITPSVYLYSGLVLDQFRRHRFIFKNYAGKELRLTFPSEFSPCGLPSSHVPLLFFQLVRLGNTSDPLRFQIIEPSDYVNTWESYPKRRIK